MREHGGNIEAESAVGAGATFTLTLPVSEAQKAVQPKEDASVPKQHQGHILVWSMTRRWSARPSARDSEDAYGPWTWP